MQFSALLFATTFLALTSAAPVEDGKVKNWFHHLGDKVKGDVNKIKKIEHKIIHCPMSQAVQCVEEAGSAGSTCGGAIAEEGVNLLVDAKCAEAVYSFGKDVKTCKGCFF